MIFWDMSNKIKLFQILKFFFISVFISYSQIDNTVFPNNWYKHEYLNDKFQVELDFTAEKKIEKRIFNVLGDIFDEITICRIERKGLDVSIFISEKEEIELIDLDRTINTKKFYKRINRKYRNYDSEKNYNFEFRKLRFFKDNFKITEVLNSSLLQLISGQLLDLYWVEYHSVEVFKKQNDVIHLIKVVPRYREGFGKEETNKFINYFNENLKGDKYRITSFKDPINGKLLPNELQAPMELTSELSSMMLTTHIKYNNVLLNTYMEIFNINQKSKFLFYLKN